MRICFPNYRIRRFETLAILMLWLLIHPVNCFILRPIPSTISVCRNNLERSRIDSILHFYFWIPCAVRCADVVGASRPYHGQSRELVRRNADTVNPHICLKALKANSRTELHIFSSSSMANENIDDDLELVQEEEYMKLWERLYYQSGTNSDFVGYDEVSEQSAITTNEEIRVLTFDLDNTIWKTTPTIEDSNNALHSYLERNLQKFGLSALNRCQHRVEIIMKLLMNENPTKYCYMAEQTFPAAPHVHNKSLTSPLDIQKSSLSPIQLTLLRKDAVEAVIRQSGYNESYNETINEIVEDAFDCWMRARQKSIENNLANHAIDTLAKIKKLRCNDTQILVGAITDGNSNPLHMDMFKDYFDFCVNAEEVGISKPSRQIYLYAARMYILPMLNLTKNKSSKASLAFVDAGRNDDKSDYITGGFARESTNPDFMTLPSYDYRYKSNQWKGSTGQENYAYINDPVDDDELSNEEIESIIGPWWIHVGDDFVKDIVAAKNLKLRTIWCRELIQDQISPDKGTIANGTDPPQLRTIEERLQSLHLKVSESKNDGLKMQIGAEDYLVDGIKNEFCDAIVDHFENIPSILQKWISPQQSLTSEKLFAAYQSTLANPLPNECKPVSQNTSTPPTRVEVQDVNNQDNKQAHQKSKTSDSKFCFECGAKLPVTAKFCTECGVKQT